MILSLALVLASYAQKPPLHDYVQQFSHTGPYGFSPWQIQYPAGEDMEGYASPVSAQVGECINFYVKSQLPFKAELYRMGYRTPLVGKTNWLTPLEQSSQIDPITMDARWKKAFNYRVPQGWHSGFYLVKLIDRKGRQAYIPFVINDRYPKADFGIVLSTNTYQAYNNWGGKSLYAYNSTNEKAATTVSFNRPYDRACGAGDFFTYEYPFIHWIEKKGYSVTYFSDTDIHKGILDRSSIKGLLIPGHDEYWSKSMRDSVEHHVNQGMNLGLFNANIGYWQVRLEQGSRNLVCYRDAAIDPILKKNPMQVTTRFRSRYIQRPEDELFGVMYQGIPNRIYPMVIGKTDHWIFKGTTLRPGDCIQGIVGGEIDNNMRNLKHVQIITHSPVSLKGYSQPIHDKKPEHDVDYSKTYSDMVWVSRTGRGSIFSAGTFRWSVYLETKFPWVFKNRNIERMTVNVLDHLKQR